VFLSAHTSAAETNMAFRIDRISEPPAKAAASTTAMQAFRQPCPENSD